MPTTDLPCNAYNVYQVNSLPPATGTLGRATSLHAGTATVKLSGIREYRPELWPINQWLPSQSGQDKAVTWRAFTDHCHVIKFNAPNRVDVLGAYGDMGEAVGDWQVLPSCYVDVPRKSPECAASPDGNRSTYQAHILSTKPWSVRSLEISCPGYPGDPIMDICPTSGSFFTSPNLDARVAEMEKVSCTAFYYD